MTSATPGVATTAMRARDRRRVRLKPDTTLRRKRLLDLLLEADLIAGTEAILFRENLTTRIQQIVRWCHPNLVFVRRRAASEQYRNRITVLLLPVGNELPLVGHDVDPDHRQSLIPIAVVQLLDFGERGVAVGTRRKEKHNERRFAKHVGQRLLDAVQRLQLERPELLG